MQDCSSINVHTVNYITQSGQVFYYVVELSIDLCHFAVKKEYLQQNVLNQCLNFLYLKYKRSQILHSWPSYLFCN